MAEKMWRISICMIMAFLLCACAGNTNMEKKVRDLDFTVVSTADISEELKKHIEERDMLQEQAGFYKRYSKTIDVDVTECKNAEESAMKILEKIAQ